MRSSGVASWFAPTRRAARIAGALAVTQTVDDPDEQTTIAADERGVVAAPCLAWEAAPEHPDARTPRGLLRELARPDARAFTDAHVDVHLVGELADGREPDAETRRARRPSFERPSHVGDTVAPVGRDDLEPTVFAALRCAHQDDTQFCVGQLIVRELTRDVHQLGRGNLAEPDPLPLCPHPLANEGDGRFVDHRNALGFPSPRAHRV
jgi:hypothetical protein